MAMISRDPFARTELHRKLVKDPNGSGCRWCGARRESHAGNELNTLFQYSTVSDDGHVSTHAGLFCSKSCHDAYHR